jgi:hypothetical protein
MYTARPPGVERRDPLPRWLGFGAPSRGRFQPDRIKVGRRWARRVIRASIYVLHTVSGAVQAGRPYKQTGFLNLQNYKF